MNEQPVPPDAVVVTGVNVNSGGNAVINNLAVGTNPLAVATITGPPPPLIADDGTVLDQQALRQALDRLLDAIGALDDRPASHRCHESFTDLRVALAGPEPKRSRALQILGTFADGSAAGQTLAAAIGAVLAVLGAH
jgi:hypothetical protein